MQIALGLIVLAFGAGLVVALLSGEVQQPSDAPLARLANRSLVAMLLVLGGWLLLQGTIEGAIGEEASEKLGLVVVSLPVVVCALSLGTWLYMAAPIAYRWHPRAHTATDTDKKLVEVGSRIGGLSLLVVGVGWFLASIYFMVVGL